MSKENMQDFINKVANDFSTVYQSLEAHRALLPDQIPMDIPCSTPKPYDSECLSDTFVKSETNEKTSVDLHVDQNDKNEKPKPDNPNSNGSPCD